MRYLYIGLSLLIAITVHEFAHAVMAYIFGDDTAKIDGRISLNPFKHLDIVGVLCLIIFRFGWARAVPIDTYKFKNYNIGLFFVSIAGIVMNLLMAFIAVQIIKFFPQIFVNFSEFFQYFISINISLALFNLIPIPPLDGSNILLSFFPKEVQYHTYNFRKYGIFILFLLIFSGFVDKYITFFMDKILLWMI